LCVFHGSFDAAAAQALGVSPHVLAALVDKSLVRRAASGRVSLHELMRQFAAEQLAAMGVDAATLTYDHARYYLHWLHNQTARLKGREQKEALGAVSADFDNLRAAWQTTSAQSAVEALQPAVEPLYYYCLLRSRLVEGIALFETATAGVDRVAYPTLSIHLRNALAKLLLGVSRVEEACALLADVLAEPALADLPHLEAAARRYYGNALVSLGDLAAAEDAFARSRALTEALGDECAEANTLLDWARLAFVRKQLDVAEGYCRAGLSRAEPSGDLLLIANFLTAISILRREAGDLDAAHSYVERSLAVYAELDDTYGLIQGCLTLGALLLQRQRGDEARLLFEQALAGSRQIGFRWGEAAIGVWGRLPGAAATGRRWRPTGARRWRSRWTSAKSNWCAMSWRMPWRHTPPTRLRCVHCCSGRSVNPA
jgi:tetratricopeptide (TPR) repeat protein